MVTAEIEQSFSYILFLLPRHTNAPSILTVFYFTVNIEGTNHRGEIEGSCTLLSILFKVSRGSLEFNLDSRSYRMSWLG